MPETLYEAIGGAVSCRALAVAFYARVAQDPVLRPLFPGKTMTCAIEEFSAFLSQFLGGRSEDTQRRWWLSLRESHARFRITREHRVAWMENMVRALDEVPLSEPERNILRRFFEEISSFMVNVPTSGEAPTGEGLNSEIADRWRVQLALEKTVAAVRRGDAIEAIRLAEESGFGTACGSVTAGILSLMTGSGQERMLEYVSERVLRDPALVDGRFAGRTLLHDAAANGVLKIAERLLDAGADVNARQPTGHTPLYCVANECSSPGAGEVVRLLVKHGAAVDAADGVKRCTPLHMAARRGNVEVAAALLDCGADIEARNSLGETPLRRAVNCKKAAVAAFLLERGADADSRGSQGATPRMAARNAAMKRLFTVGYV